MCGALINTLTITIAFVGNKVCQTFFPCLYPSLFLQQTFVYPDNVAFPFGGEGFPEYLVMELHYDNPDMINGAH